MSSPRISIVIPTYNRARLLRRCLESLRGQTADADVFEVIVVDDASTDDTPALLANATGVAAVRQPVNAGPAAARNRGLTMARGALVLFLDDDIAADPGLVARHLAAHEGADERLGILGRVDWDSSLRVTRFMRWLDRSGLQFGYETWLQPGPVDPPYAAFYTANLSMGRSLIESVGGFDERFPHPAFEDIELAFRLAARGFHLVYDPAARAYHTRSMTLRGFCRRMHAVGQSAALLRQAAPDFPLDDESLLADPGTRWHRVRLALRGLADAKARERFYWAEVRQAYRRGLATGLAGN